jgi:hypothetical protein
MPPPAPPQVEAGVETTLVMEWDTPSVTTAVVDAVCCELHVPSKVRTT